MQRRELLKGLLVATPALCLRNYVGANHKSQNRKPEIANRSIPLPPNFQF